MVKTDKKVITYKGGPGGAGGFYLLGCIGAAAHFVGNTEGFWNLIVALLKALVWPAFLINRVFDALNI